MRIVESRNKANVNKDARGVFIVNLSPLVMNTDNTFTRLLPPSVVLCRKQVYQLVRRAFEHSKRIVHIPDTILTDGLAVSRSFSPSLSSSSHTRLALSVTDWRIYTACATSPTVSLQKCSHCRSRFSGTEKSGISKTRSPLPSTYCAIQIAFASPNILTEVLARVVP